MKIILPEMVQFKDLAIGTWFKMYGGHYLKVSESEFFNQLRLVGVSTTTYVEPLEASYVSQGPQFKDVKNGDFIYAFGEIYLKLDDRQVFNIRSRCLGVIEPDKQVDVLLFGVKLQ